MIDCRQFFPGGAHLSARSLDSAQFACACDHGATWTWADWKFNPNFGCPTVLSYAKNCAGARDDCDYVHSLDRGDAYDATGGHDAEVLIACIVLNT